MRLFIALIKDELLLGIVKPNFNIEKNYVYCTWQSFVY